MLEASPFTSQGTNEYARSRQASGRYFRKEPADHQEMPYRAAIRRAFASSLSYRLAWTFFAGLEARGCAVSGAAAVSGLRVSGWTASALGASGLGMSVSAGVSLADSTWPRLPPG